MATKIGEYQGNPTITFDPEERFAFQRGAGKLRKVLENFDDVIAFLKSVNGEKNAEALKKFVQSKFVQSLIAGGK